MILSIRLFAAAHEAVGEDVVSLPLEDGATVAQLRHALVEQFPSLAAWEHHLLIAVNQQYVLETHELAPDDEVACFPPVSGG